MRNATRSAALFGIALGTLVPALGTRAQQDAPAPPAAGAPAAPPASVRQLDEVDPTRAGAAVVGTGSATVVAIDRDDRIVFLRTADGTMIPVKCGKDVTHLDQIKEGDEVKAVAIGRVANYVGKDAPPDGGAGRVVMRTMQDGKPGFVIVDTTQTQEKVEAVDAAGKTLTLKGDDDGTPTQISVAPEVDLSGIEKGDEVTVRATGGLALSVQRPQAGEAQPAGATIVTETRTATVEAVDQKKRIVTLKNAEGKTLTVQVGKEAVNFNQIKKGDQVRATMAEEVAVSVDKSGAPAASEELRFVSVAPKGAKPGIMVVDSKTVTGKIQSIDAQKRTVTLAGGDGVEPRTVKVAQDVDLAKLMAGDDVSARVTGAMAIVVEKPQQPQQKPQ